MKNLNTQHSEKISRFLYLDIFKETICSPKNQACKKAKKSCKKQLNILKKATNKQKFETYINLKEERANGMKASNEDQCFFNALQKDPLIQDYEKEMSQ